MAKRIHAVACLLALLLTVAACSSQADKPADQILDEARKAADEASSVRITGNLKQGNSTGRVELLLTNSGDGKETITSAGQTVNVVKVGNSVYAKGVPGQAAGFQQISADAPAARKLVEAVNKKALLDQLLDPKQKFTKAGTGKVGDQEVVKLKQKQGNAMFYIADDSENPYPLKIESTGQQGGLTIRLAEWDAGATIKPPPTGGR